MTGQDSGSPSLSLRLEPGWLKSDNKFQLNRRREINLGLLEVTSFETERAVTLVCNNLHTEGRTRKLHLLGALQSGLMELVDSSDNHIIAFPRSTEQQLGQLNILPKSLPRLTQVDVGIHADTTNAVWKEILQPGNTYELRLSQSRDEVWAYYTDSYSGYPANVPSSIQKLIVERDPSTIHFTVDDLPAPPNLFAKLIMPSECRLHGPGHFTFVIEYSTDSTQPITINKSRSPLSVFEEDLKTVEYLLEVRDVATGEEVQWSAFFGCYDSDPHPAFPADEEFVEIVQGKPWRYEYTLLNLDDHTDTVGSMWGLDAGKRYRAKISDRVLRFTSWMFGKKEEMLIGSLEEKMKRWDVDQHTTGTLYAEIVGDPVEFAVVEGGDGSRSSS